MSDVEADPNITFIIIDSTFRELRKFGTANSIPINVMLIVARLFFVSLADYKKIIDQIIAF